MNVQEVKSVRAQVLSNMERGPNVITMVEVCGEVVGLVLMGREFGASSVSLDRKLELRRVPASVDFSFVVANALVSFVS